MLRPGEQEKTETDSIPDTIKPSHVQVYRLVTNLKVSTEKWQFPSGPPHGTPLVAGKVEVFTRRLEANGNVAYADGTTASDKHKLDPFPRPCPELPGDKKE